MTQRKADFTKKIKPARKHAAELREMHLAQAKSCLSSYDLNHWERGFCEDVLVKMSPPRHEDLTTNQAAKLGEIYRIKGV